MFGAIQDPLPESRMIDSCDLSPPEEWKGVQEQPDQHDHQTAANDLPDHFFRRTLAQRKMCGDSDDEEEERKYQIGRRPAIPRRVLERRINRTPRSGVVDEQHAGDRRAAKNIEGSQPLAGRWKG